MQLVVDPPPPPNYGPDPAVQKVQDADPDIYKY